MSAEQNFGLSATPGGHFMNETNYFSFIFRYEKDNNDNEDKNDAMDTVEGNNKTKNIIDNKDVVTTDEQGKDGRDQDYIYVQGPR